MFAMTKDNSEFNHIDSYLVKNVNTSPNKRIFHEYSSLDDIFNSVTSRSNYHKKNKSIVDPKSLSKKTKENNLTSKINLSEINNLIFESPSHYNNTEILASKIQDKLKFPKIKKNIPISSKIKGYQTKRYENELQSKTKINLLMDYLQRLNNNNNRIQIYGKNHNYRSSLNKKSNFKEKSEQNIYSPPSSVLLKKQSSRKIIVLSREMQPNYYILIKNIEDLLKNIKEMTEIVCNSKKLFQLVSGFIGYKNLILKKILLNEESESLIRPLTLHILEEKCFIKEIIQDGNITINKEKMEEGIINELQDLNSKLENYNTSFAIDKIKFMENQLIDEFHKMKIIEKKIFSFKKKVLMKDYKPIEKFNYNNFTDISLFEDINNFELTYGKCPLVNNRSRKICEAIESSVKNVKNYCN